MWNFLQGDIFGLTVSGREAYAVVTTQMAGSNLLAGGSYGVEGGLFVTAVLLLAFVYAKFCIKPTGKAFWTMNSDLPLIRGQK